MLDLNRPKSNESDARLTVLCLSFVFLIGVWFSIQSPTNTGRTIRSEASKMLGKARAGLPSGTYAAVFAFIDSYLLSPTLSPARVLLHLFSRPVAPDGIRTGWRPVTLALPDSDAIKLWKEEQRALIRENPANGYHEQEVQGTMSSAARQYHLDVDFWQGAIDTLENSYLKHSSFLSLIPVTIPKLKVIRYPLPLPGIFRPPVTVLYVNFRHLQALCQTIEIQPNCVLASMITAPENEDKFFKAPKTCVYSMQRMLQAFVAAGAGGTNALARCQDTLIISSLDLRVLDICVLVEEYNVYSASCEL
ncbi:hypothetical protein IW262DRAFT_1462081 [Armillaria fumosa]|nr:hypothetical protein IW262DRAFT_1462081 [Armillaria fumosa]